MINQYLFLDDKHRNTIDAYKKPNGIIIEFSNIKNTPLWLVECFIKGNNSTSAKKLSDVHKFIMEYSPKTLACGSSEYYNKKLFPIINNLERKLRKLLYLADSISNNEEDKKNISDLEDKGLGDISEMLFVDKEFINNVKKCSKGADEFKKMGRYSKLEILASIADIEENTLWDKLLGVDCKFTIKNHFRDVIKYRNSVMHAHNIDKKRYEKARCLFNKINNEFDQYINKIILQEKDKKIIVNKDFNRLISSAIKEMDFSIADSLKYFTYKPFKNIHSIQLPTNIVDAICAQISLNIVDSKIKDYLPQNIKFLENNDEVTDENNEENEDIKKDKDDTNEK